MFNFKQIICATGWSMVHNEKDDFAEELFEKKKEIVESFRVAIELNSDDFSDLATKDDDEIFQLLDSLDPISKGLTLKLILDVAFVGFDELRDEDWNLYITIRDFMNINSKIDKCIEDDYIELTRLIRGGEKRNIEIWQSYCNNYFSALESEGRFEQWKNELERMNSTKVKWLALDKAVLYSLKEVEKKENEITRKLKLAKKELAKNIIEEQKISEKENQLSLKNKTHEVSISHGVEYCRFCGTTNELYKADCRREYGHRYSVKKLKNGKWQPKCSKCGIEGFAFQTCSTY